MSTNFHIRKIEDNILIKLKQEAANQGVSMNTLILNILRHSVGINLKQTKQIYHDLDNLAGTWSNKEFTEFKRNTADFEKIDEELWK